MFRFLLHSTPVYMEMDFAAFDIGNCCSFQSHFVDGFEYEGNDFAWAGYIDAEKFIV